MSKYIYFQESFKVYDLELLKELSKVSKTVIERVSTEWTDRSEDLRMAAPNFKPVFNAYMTHLKKLREECENDESLKDIIEVV